MFFKMYVVLLIFLHTYVVMASDPDPVEDFCIPNEEPSPGFHPCKNPSLVMVEDFVFSGIKERVEVGEGELLSTVVNSSTFPGINTLGMSFLQADFGIGGINVPHYHPRATETVFVLEGKIYVGFVDSQNRLFAKVIEKGEVIVLSKGLLHFQMNVGDSPAALLAVFNSQNPGLVKIPHAIFGSEIDDELLKKAFGLNSKVISKLKKKFGNHS